MMRGWVPVATAVAAAAVLGTAVALVSSDRGRSGNDVLAPPPAAAAPSASASSAASPAPDDPERPASSQPSTSPSPMTSPVPVARAPRPAPTPMRAAPAASSPVATPTPKPAPTASRRATYSFDAAYGTDDPKQVVVQYGDSSSCPHQRVTHTVTETPDRVVVTLEADAMDPERACTADYQQRLVTIRLQQPMSGRTLVDGHRNEPVEVDRRCRREFASPPPPKDCDPT